VSEPTTINERPAGTGPVDWPTVPGYEVVAELGRGGMGVVYKARQESSGRFVAIKVIRDGALASPQERARFRIEAAAAARVQHPNVVPIYEVGEHAGRPYFAMELVGGGSLEQYVAGRPQPPQPAAKLVRTLAQAVQCAHDGKVIHRDLKPANILLKSESEQLEPKITDFGLAKRLDSDSTAWTKDGAVLGTPGYMAPEQAAGRVRDIGPAADLYALGAILYELLTGHPPFHGDSWNETLRQVINDDPEPPTRLRPDVPRDLESVCLKCLEKDPARRYPSASELADDLGRFLDGLPVLALPLSAVQRLARRAERDGYQVVAELGRGPHGTVYHALSGPLKQPVVLKVFRSEACTREEWESQLRRAADLRSALAHPQIVPVLDAGWWDAAPYLALEFVPHGSLAARLNGRRFPLDQAIRLIEQLIEIVRYLHRQGVVHGNLKPSNVLFAADGIPRVVDFRPPVGVVPGPLTVVDDEPAGLAYLAPELVQDPLADARPHTDVYGLGAIFYTLLTGRPPFAGDTAQETLDQVRSQEPAPLSRHNADIPPHLEAFCLRCLRKNPWRRYHRAFDLMTWLRHFKDSPDGRSIPTSRR